MSRLSQFYFDDNVGDYRESADFFDQIQGDFNTYDDGYKFYVRTGTYVLNPPDRVKNDANTMQRYGRIGGSQHINFRGNNNGDIVEDGIVSANGWYMFSSGGLVGASTYGQTHTSLLMRSQDEFATYSFVDTAPYIHQHIAMANGIPFLFGSQAAIGGTVFAPHRMNVLKSHDGGATWTPLLPENVLSYKCTQVAYFNSTYFIVTDHGIFYSTDAYADTWNELGGPFKTGDQVSSNYSARMLGQNPASGTYPRNIIWDGSRYSVLVDASSTMSTGANQAFVLYNTSLSEFGWIKATLPDTSNAPTKLVYVNNKAFLTFSSRGFQYSSSGTSYVQTSLPSTSTATAVYDILWESANSRYWTATSGGVYQSADGITFTAVTGTGQTITDVKLLNGVVYTSNINGSVSKSTSGNAMTTTAQTGPVRGQRVAIANGKIFVYGCGVTSYTNPSVGVTAYPCIRTTTDAATFTSKMAIGPLRKFMVDEAANCMIIAQCNVITKFNATTQIYTSHFITDREANVIIKTANNLYTIGGRYSTDLDTWTAPTGMTGNVQDMAISSNGMLMAVNSAGAWYSSSNGTTWTSITGGASEYVVYGDGTFVALAASNSQNVMVSTNGVAFQAGPYFNTSAVAHRGITYDPNRKSFYGVSYFQDKIATVIQHVDPFNDKQRNITMAPYANCDTIIVGEQEQYNSNISGYYVMAYDQSLSRAVTVQLTTSGSTVNVSNSQTFMISRAGDLIFMSCTASFGTPNTTNSIKYAPTIGSFRANAIVTGSSNYANPAGGLLWKNATLNSCTKFDGKYWLPSWLNNVGWSEFKKDIIYVPGDGSKFLRVY
jgi:hypothetical protein